MSTASSQGNGGAKSARTRQRILDAAAHVLSRKGYAGTRLTDVADRAELQAPAIYYYFTSREEMIAEVMVVGQRRLYEHVASALLSVEPDTDPIERICVAVEAHLRVELHLSEFATAVTRNLGQLPDDIRTRLRSDGAAYIALWRQLFHDARTAGAIHPDLDPSAARMLIIGALNWTAEWWDAHRGSLPQLIDTAQRIVRNALTE